MIHNYRYNPPPPPLEVYGQCTKCGDLFPVYLLQKQGQLIVQQTTRLQLREIPDEKEPLLIHRPDLCNGQVKLYGHPQRYTETPFRHFL